MLDKLIIISLLKFLLEKSNLQKIITLDGHITKWF